MGEEKVVTSVTPVVKPTPPVVEQPKVETEPTAPVTPVVEEEKLLAGKYKTVEELEAGYSSSNSEATRMAQEINRLKQMVQSSLTPGEKQEVKEKVIDLDKHFDPETSRVLNSYFSQLVDKRVTDTAQATKEQSDFQTQVTSNWQETLKAYPEAADTKGKLYLRANEILFERGLASVDQAGKVVLVTPFAYRMAVEAASLELSKQATPSANKTKINAIAGKGGKSAPQGKLTYESYMALPSDEERDAYDQSQR